MPEQCILIVEDDPLIRDLLSHTLLDRGYSVDAVGTVAEAGHRLSAKTYAVVVADLRLPDGDGTLVADAAADQGAKTLIMSGYLFQTADGHAERHLTLMKPVRPSEIVAIIEHSIREPKA